METKPTQSSLKVNLALEPSNPGKLLVVGAAVLDRILYVSSLPRKGETVIGDRIEVHPGGKGANQALAAARIGANVRFITSVGEDEAADLVLAPLKEAGVDLDFIFKSGDASTAEALIAVDAKGENQIVACPGAYKLFTPEMVQEREDSFEWAEWVMLQNELPRPAVDEAIKLAKKHKTKILFNPAPMRKHSSPLPRDIDVLVPNEIEAATLVGVEDYLAIAPTDRVAPWKEVGAHHVIVTLGAQGGEWFNSNGKRIQHDAFKVDAIDTVGAGDAFCGILAATLSEQLAFEDAIELSHYGAALSTTKRGAQEGLPKREYLLNE